MTLWTPEKTILKSPYRVLLARGIFTDEARSGREVPYKLYYPVDHPLDKMPLVVWSHGFGGNRDGAAFISRFLAGQGYALLHLTHAGTDSSLWEGRDEHPWDVLRKVKIPRDITLDRMRDVPFALDALQNWAMENPDIGQHIDFETIGMSGHSFGAMTTQVMAGMLFPDTDGTLTSMRDPRFSCGILYSPVPIAHLTDAAPQDLYGPIDIPLFHMTGTRDDSPLENFGYEERLIIREHAGHPEQHVQILPDGDHMVYNGTRGKLAKNPKREEHEQLILHGAYAFWEAYLKGNDDARLWLQHPE